MVRAKLENHGGARMGNNSHLSSEMLTSLTVLCQLSLTHLIFKKSFNFKANAAAAFHDHCLFFPDLVRVSMYSWRALFAVSIAAYRCTNTVRGD